MKRPSLDEYYLNIAKAVSERSTCLKKHYGAVIVKNGEIISTGYNNPPRGEPHCWQCTKLALVQMKKLILAARVCMLNKMQ